MAAIKYQLRLPYGSDGDEGGVPPIDACFDIAFANRIAELESYNKHLYRPNTYLHKWWARRCGSTFRLILKHLVQDEAQRDYYAPGGLAGKVILDPMIGGGTTLHEAIRMEASVIGADIDPIPVLQARATLSKLPLSELEAAFEHLYRELRARLAPYFQTSCPTCGGTTDLQFLLHGLLKNCDCGPAIFVNSLILRYDTDGTVTRLCPRCYAITRAALSTADSCGCPPCSDNPPIVEKSADSCPVCRTLFREDYQRPFYSRYTPLAIVGQCASCGPFFSKPTEADLTLIEQADDVRAGLDFGPETDFAVQPGPKSTDLINHGIRNYRDLFSSRQLLFLEEAIQILKRFPELVRLNLALLVSTSLEFNSMLCGYKGGDKYRPGAIRHTFSHHAYSFPYTALENNPLYPTKASGTLQNLFDDRLRRGRRWALLPQERIVKNGKAEVITLRGEVDEGIEVSAATDLRSGTRRFMLLQGSSTALNLEADSVDYVVTDPPYFDSVQYSDLAAFFRVWLRRLAPDAAHWEYNLAESAVDPQKNGKAQYMDVLAGIFAECHRVLRKDRGRLIFTFHHWNPKGWAALTLALRHGGFVLLNRYVVHAENPVSVHIANLKALTHDAILVLAPVESAQRSVWQRRAVVNRTDSLHFCADCATNLGWLLNSDLPDTEIEQFWHGLLVEKGR